MNRTLKLILNVISYINVVFLVSLTAITVVDVVARYVFNTSFFDAMTMSSFLLAIMNALALAVITYKNEHVQVEVVYRWLPPALKTVFDSINTLLASIVFFIMAWFSFSKAFASYHRGIYQGWMRIPEYPAKCLFAFGCLMTAIIFLFLFVSRFMKNNRR